MHGSNSAPALMATGYKSGPDFHKSHTAGNRGSHDVLKGDGACPHSGNDLYVPRAMWSEAVDSPMKVSNRKSDWHPHQFLEEEKARASGRETLKSYLVGQYAKQGAEKAAQKGDGKADTKREAMQLDVEFAKNAKQELMKTEKLQENKRIMKAGLDAQQAELRALEMQSRIGEAREAAEVKLRNAQQLADDMNRGSRRRQQATENAQHMKAQAESKERQKRLDRASEVNEFRQQMKDTLHQDELKLMASQLRMREGNDREAARGAANEVGAGKQERERLKAESDRQEIDAKKHELRTELYYARREQARERQRQEMIRSLHEQSAFRQSQNADDGEGKKRESAALAAAMRMNMENDLQKASSKRQKAETVAQHNLAACAEKQKMEMAQGHRRPPQTATMFSPVGVGVPGASPKADPHSKNVNAARYVNKPCGRTDLAQSVPTRSKGGLYAANSALMARDERLEFKWSTGLTQQDMKTAMHAARQRETRAALGRADWQ